MKLPLLFGKIPKHQKFKYTPRHYDEQKEEMAKRKRLLTQEVEGSLEEMRSTPQDRIRTAFHSTRQRKSRSLTSTTRTALIRLGVLLVLTLTIMAYLQWGIVGLYLLILAIPIYLFYKMQTR